MRRLVYGLLLLAVLLPVPALLLTGFNFGHTNAVEEQVEELDQKILRRRRGDTDPTGGGNGGGCMLDYPDWLQGLDSREDLKRELLRPDTEPTPSLAVQGNDDFVEVDDGGVVTADTILKRCNTYFRDKNNNDIQHWVYCRAMQLPSGDTFSNLTELKNDPDSSPAGHYNVAFFHGSNVDDPSENWLVPMINKYQDQCLDRAVNIIWVGVWVTDLSESPPDPMLTLGNKWHVTASDWENTVLFDVMAESQLNFSGHSTASCPFDGPDADTLPDADTHGLWVGGTDELKGRRINDRYTDEQSLWVGSGSDSQAACYSGVTSGNPVNANNDRGIQFEYQVTVPEESDTWVRPESIAENVLDEF